MIIAAAVSAAVQAAHEATYCAVNGIELPEPKKSPDNPFVETMADSPWMWLPMFLIGLVG